VSLSTNGETQKHIDLVDRIMSHKWVQNQRFHSIAPRVFFEDGYDSGEMDISGINGRIVYLEGKSGSTNGHNAQAQRFYTVFGPKNEFYLVTYRTGCLNFRKVPPEKETIEKHKERRSLRKRKIVLRVRNPNSGINEPKMLQVTLPSDYQRTRKLYLPG